MSDAVYVILLLSKVSVFSFKIKKKNKSHSGAIESQCRFQKAEREKAQYFFCTLAVRVDSIESTGPVMRVEPGESVSSSSEILTQGEC